MASLPKSDHENSISVVVPLFNEAESVRELHDRLLTALRPLGRPFEIIFVDDGSRDETFARARILLPSTLIRLRRNCGQTVALAVGIQEAKGDIIVTMDGDLENDPADIPMLLGKLDEGYDIVSGWRKGRWQDQPLSRRLPSSIANRVISWVSGVRLHDHGCQLKAYRRSYLTGLDFSGDMHRMTAAYAARDGARLAEIPVRFEKRKYGVSKYRLTRIFKVLLDVLAFHFFRQFSTRPLHFFGAIGFAMFLLGGLTFLLMVGLRLFLNMSFIVTPLPTLTAFFLIVAVQFVLMGLLAEMVHRRLGTLNPARHDVVAERVANREG